MTKRRSTVYLRVEPRRDDLLELITNNRIRCQGYADDIVILVRGKFENSRRHCSKRLKSGKEMVQYGWTKYKPDKNDHRPFYQKKIPSELMDHNSKRQKSSHVEVKVK